MLAENINDNASGYVNIFGKTTLLKVNGTADIAIGDWISCHTSAGIGKKALDGETAFAYALEAYATDDDNGVIDAILVSPRVVNVTGAIGATGPTGATGYTGYTGFTGYTGYTGPPA
jgi:hypothetical protein